ncbi:hypothetical protein D3C71_1610340 [compost metagenome]
MKNISLLWLDETKHFTVPSRRYTKLKMELDACLVAAKLLNWRCSIQTENSGNGYRIVFAREDGNVETRMFMQFKTQEGYLDQISLHQGNYTYNEIINEGTTKDWLKSVRKLRKYL